MLVGRFENPDRAGNLPVLPGTVLADVGEPWYRPTPTVVQGPGPEAARRKPTLYSCRSDNALEASGGSGLVEWRAGRADADMESRRTYHTDAPGDDDAPPDDEPARGRDAGSRRIAGWSSGPLAD
jgi:hypothetical protein